MKPDELGGNHGQGVPVVRVRVRVYVWIGVKGFGCDLLKGASSPGEEEA